MHDSRPHMIGDRPLGAVGYGMLGLTKPWALVPMDEAATILKAALVNGSNLWNGGIHYGTPDMNSLHVLRYYFEKNPGDTEKVIISIKGAYDPVTGPDGTPDGIRSSVDAALDVLGGHKKIDIFECARVDPEVPIETSMKALAQLVAEGKIGGVGLSEVSANTIRRAHAVHPIAAVEVELSLFTPDPAYNGILETCHELGILVLAYSPISRGWLTGDLRKPDDLAKDDFRRRLPRFQASAFDQNVKLVEAVDKIAQRKSSTIAQVALSWVAKQGAMPIPGSVRVERVKENCQLVDLEIEDLAELEGLLKRFPIVGERYGGQQEALLNG